MSLYKQIISNFFDAIDDFNLEEISRLSEIHREKIHYIQLPILNKAGRDYNGYKNIQGHKDISCLRVLVDEGFEIFVDSSCYGLEGYAQIVPMEHLHTAWAGPRIPDPELVEFMSHIYDTQYPNAKELFSGLPDSDFSTHEDTLEELQFLKKNPEGYVEFIFQKDAFPSIERQTPRARASRPKAP
ncbi:MAG: hypothetical protein OIF58_15705 [Cohaesibacter sp.]|nr:hypothetical protein [Cohaesibacter sp.]